MYTENHVTSLLYFFRNLVNHSKGSGVYHHQSYYIERIIEEIVWEMVDDYYDRRKLKGVFIDYLNSECTIEKVLHTIQETPKKI